VSVAVQYLESWLRGTGAVAISNLMEDTATAEIARAQVWHWTRQAATLSNGRPVTAELVRQIGDEEVASIRQALGDRAFASHCFGEARALFDEVALGPQFVEFLTLPGYRRLP
jgi:malate synthase